MVDGGCGCGFGGKAWDVIRLLLIKGLGSEGEDVRGASLADGEEVTVAGFCLRGVLKGDLKGWERVFVALFRRRRLDVEMGDMFQKELEEEWKRSGREMEERLLPGFRVVCIVVVCCDCEDMGASRIGTSAFD